MFSFFFFFSRPQVGKDPNNLSKDRMVFTDDEVVCEAKRYVEAEALPPLFILLFEICVP